MSDFDDDETLSEALADAVLDGDPDPSAIRRFGREAHRLLSFEAELAEIVEDSRTDELVAMRSGVVSRRVIRLVLGDVEIELELGDEVVGLIDPVTDQVAVVTTAERLVVEVSDRGVFRFESPTRPFRIECVVEGIPLRTVFVDPR